MVSPTMRNHKFKSKTHQRLKFSSIYLGVAMRNNSECAYHANEQITNFCKCSSCLLPVCPSCIKLHSDEHRLNGTAPKFQQIRSVLEEVKYDQISLQSEIADLSDSLLEIERSRKDNQSLIRRKVQEFKTRIVRQFERYVFELEEKLINKICRDDEHFIADLEEIDENIEVLAREVEIQKNQLNGHQYLKSIIVHLGQNRKNRIRMEIGKLKERAEEIAKKGLYIAFEEGSLDSMKEIIGQCITVEAVNEIHFQHD